MTFTYTSNPQVVTLDAIRVEIGDTIPNQHEAEDEEILYAYAMEGTVLKAAARVCEMLAAKYAKREGFRGGTIQTEKTTIAGKYLQMAKRFRARGITAGQFIMPSLSISTKQNSETDTDIPQPAFKRGVHNNPEASTDDELDTSVSGAT